MTSVTIEESGMTFGPFPEDDCLHLEQNAIYERIRQGVKIAEMAVARPARGGRALWLIEAKSSSPRPGAGEQASRFNAFIDEIRDKLGNALTLFIAIALARHGDPGAILPQGLAGLPLGQLDIRLILVVKGHRDDWCVPLQDALRGALQPLVKTFAIRPDAVAVVNDTTAREYGLISG